MLQVREILSHHFIANLLPVNDRWIIWESYGKNIGFFGPLCSVVIIPEAPVLPVAPVEPVSPIAPVDPTRFDTSVHRHNGRMYCQSWDRVKPSTTSIVIDHHNQHPFITICSWLIFLKFLLRLGSKTGLFRPTQIGLCLQQNG